MKKISLTFISSVVGLFLLLFVLTPRVFASSTLDQSPTITSSEELIWEIISPEGTPYKQSFKPTQNRLDHVNISISGNFSGGQDIKISVLDSSMAVIGSRLIAPTLGGELIETRTAEFSSSPLVLTPGATYYIEVDTQAGPENLFWYRCSTDCYPMGMSYREPEDVQTFDFLFETYGYNYVAPTTTAPITPTTTTSASSTNDVTTTKATVTTTTTKPKDAAPVDTSLEKPSLTSYTLAGKTVKAPIRKMVEIQKGEKITLTGTSFADAQVIIFYNNHSTPATMSKNGNWTIEINSAGMDIGELNINAQAKKGKVGSEIVELIPIKVLGATTQAETIEAHSNTTYMYIGLGILAVILITLIVFLQLKYKTFSRLFRRK